MIDKNQIEALRHTEYNSDPVVIEMLDTIETLWKVAEAAEKNLQLAYSGADEVAGTLAHAAAWREVDKLKDALDALRQGEK